MSADARPYTRCPACGFIAPPESMDYALAPGGGIEWDRPIRVTCLCCHASHAIGAGDVLAADAETACHRCGAAVAFPAGAARVQCTGCGLFLLGPDLSPAQRDELAMTEGLAGLALRESYLAAKERASQRREMGRDRLAPAPDRGPAIPRRMRGLAMSTASGSAPRTVSP